MKLDFENEKRARYQQEFHAALKTVRTATPSEFGLDVTLLENPDLVVNAVLARRCQTLIRDVSLYVRCFMMSDKEDTSEWEDE